MTLKLKPGVAPSGIRAELMLAIVAVAAVYDKHGVDCVLTSLMDGEHSETSLHYAGSAFDSRTRDLTPAVAAAIAQECREALGEHYDVILEGTHLHVEFQPRMRR